MSKLWIIPVVLVAGLLTLSLLSQRGSPPGLTNGALKPGSDKPNAASSEPGTPDAQKVEPLQGTRDAVRDAIEATGGTITSETDDYISATYTTRLMRYVDDVEVRRAGEGLWHIRSGSRVGHSDMGANAKRVAEIRAALKT